MSARGTILHVLVTGADAATLRALLRERRLDTGGRPRPGQGDEVSIEAYVPETEVATLEREGISVQVLADATAVGRARQAEVGTGNRFAAPHHIPRGLGRKENTA